MDKRKEVEGMEEVYIRSQNREKLYRLGGNYAGVEYVKLEDMKRKRSGEKTVTTRHTICISDDCLEEIGVYATKERCLEVLDELQKVCGTILLPTGGMEYAKVSMVCKPPIGIAISRVYEMPLE